MARGDQKRKRGDPRSYSQDDDAHSRPSPHRPQNLAHAQTQSQAYQSGSPRDGHRGGRRGSRPNGRGGFNNAHSPNTTHTSPTFPSTPANTVQANKPAPTPLPTPTPAPEQASLSSAPPPVPVINEYLTPERLANWNADARNAVIQPALAAQRDGDLFAVTLIYYEIIEATLNKRMSVEELGPLVREIVAASPDNLCVAKSVFLDAVSTSTSSEADMNQLHQMLVATEIEVSNMRSELDSFLLTNLNLVRPSFTRVGVRKATNALYRQSNYNLLREESEGYAKLITEYFTTVSNNTATQEVISATHERVNALIGAFNLDVGRVLDITLDVFANLLVKHGRFFVKLFRSSTWWPNPLCLNGVEWDEPEVSPLPGWALPSSNDTNYTDEQRDEQLHLREQRDSRFWQRVHELREQDGILTFFDLGARRITKNTRRQSNQESDQNAHLWADEWMTKTGTLPPPSNQEAAQLLGFKLRFYASDARDANDVLPDNLVNLAALLIKIGFISLVDLYPHLYPQDQDMPAHKAKLLAEKKRKEDKARGKSNNALAMAGALPDDTAPAGGVSRLRETESKTSSRVESPQSDGGKLPDPADQKVALLKSLLCIGAIPEALFILGRFPWLLEVYPDINTYIFRLAHHALSKVYDSAKPTPSQPIPVAAKGIMNQTFPRASDFVPRRTLRWTKLEEKDAGDGIDYRFYWEDWMDNVPVCQNVDDVLKLCTTLLGFVGPACGTDIVLLTKITRIAKKNLIDDASDSNRKRWVDFSASFLTPALSYTGHNPGVVNEVWDLLKQFNTPTRYTIYNQWFGSTKPAMRAKYADVRSSTIDALKKISNNNTRDMGREIAKLTYSCPGPVFERTLYQGQTYSNMIEALVECSRYLTVLGYDCLTWTLVSAFVKDKKEKPAIQDDGMLTKPWLKNSATFIGKVYRRFSLMDPTPILQYIAAQITTPNGDLFMLTVLEQLITFMAGIRLGSSLSEARVLGVAAGPVLRAFVQEHHMADARHEARYSSKRLMRHLKENGLILRILIGLARQVEQYIEREDLEDAPAKVVLTNLDNLNLNLAQYLDLLRSNTSVDEFDEMVPSVAELMATYHVEPRLAFTISRASLSRKANTHRNSDKGVDVPEANSLPKEIDTEMTEPATSVDTEMQEASNATGPSNGPSSLLQPISNPEIEQLADELRARVPAHFGSHPCVQFYITFWQLSLIDVYAPNGTVLDGQYKEAIASVTKANRAVDQKYEQNKLKEEQRQISMEAVRIQSHLQEEMQGWFEDIPMVDAPSNEIHHTILQDCFLPRSQMSQEDAQFASAMLWFMHNSGVPGFRTIKLLDQLFNSSKLTGIIIMSSENESRNLGRFIHNILRELQRWQESKDLYAKSTSGVDKPLPGFARRFNPDRTPADFLSHEDFCTLLFKWHKSIFTALKMALESGDYMRIRNAINILKATAPIFPKVDFMANDLRQPIQQMGLNDDRNDIKVAANSIIYEFKKSQKQWKSENQFRKLAPGPKTTTSEARTPRSRDSDTPKLNAAAPSFTPNATESANMSMEHEDQAHRPVSTSTGLTSSATPAEPRPSAPSQVREPPRSGPGSRPPPVHDMTESRHSGHYPNTPTNRVPHALPSRPDGQPPRARPGDRSSDRPAEHPSNGRQDNRASHPSDGVRLDRSVEHMREREASPGRRPRGRTPDRLASSTERHEWSGRNTRDYEERSMRAPPRDMRAPLHRGAGWDPRDPRDSRDRMDQRPLPHSSSMDSRARFPPNSAANVDDNHRRGISSASHPAGDRGILPPRPMGNTSSNNDRPPLLNPERAVYINDEHAPNESPKHERDSRRDRGSRPQSPRRTDDRRDDRAPAPYPARGDATREHRDDRLPLQTYPVGRDRRDEPTGIAPTGPRGGRNDAPSSSRISREMFQPSQSGRPTGHQAQDPNYGRLNPPSDTIPSGPRNFTSDRRESHPPMATPPAGPAAPQANSIHPSRLTNFRAPPLQTDVPGAPSGPRSSARTPQDSFPSSRGPPTGPASADRNPRNAENRPNPLRAINSVLTGNAPNGSERHSERNPPTQNTQIRGRGANRSNGYNEPPTSQVPPSQMHPSNPYPPRPTRGEMPPNRLDLSSQDDGRLDPRGYRERRSERPGRDRSRSPDRGDRKPDERSTRNGPSDRTSRGDEQDGMVDRDRGASRDKRGSDRESGRRDRDREREGDRSFRDRRDRGPREDTRMPREEMRPPRDDGRLPRDEMRPARDERDRRLRDDGRKRGRDVGDQPHGDIKRRR